MKVLLWLFLFALIVSASVAVVLWLRARREREAMWSSLEGEPSLPEWNEDSFGVSSVRVHTEHPRLPEDSAPEPVAPSRTATESMTARPVTARSAPEPSEDAANQNALITADDMPDELPFAREVDHDDAPEASDGPRPMRARAEWWEDDAAGAGALLRSLVDVIGGSAALVRPDPGDGGYLLLAAAGPASHAIHAHRGARRLSSASVLDDLPRDLATMILGADESGLLPGMDPAGVGETAVRALSPAPSPRRLLIVDVPDDRSLTDEAGAMIGAYAELLARLLGLPTEAPAPEPTPEAESSVAMEEATRRISAEMDASRETGRPLALAIVVLRDAEELAEEDPDSLPDHELALRDRLEAVTGTRSVLQMGPMVMGALCESDGAGAERWVRALASTGPPLRIGVAVYGPRHVSAQQFRQDATSALHQTYSGDDTCVIVE